MILLDTQVMLWLRSGDPKLGAQARIEIDRAWHSDGVAVSAISFWEVAMLKGKGRLRFPDDVGTWRQEQIDQGISEIPVDGDIGFRATDLRVSTATRLIVSSWRLRSQATSW